MSADTLIWFGTLGAPARRRHELSPKAWTCLGLLAIPLWATWPALALQASSGSWLPALASSAAIGIVPLALGNLAWVRG